MTLEIGGLGTLGIGFETTYGTYAAPTKFLPIRSESLALVEDRQYRMNIRGLADRQNPIQGYTRIEGDIEFEVTSTTLPYFLYLARVAPSRTGVGPYVYTFAPANVTLPTTAAGVTNRKTGSLYVKRGDNVFGYAGCSVGRLAFSVVDSILMCTASLMGLTEADQTEDAETFDTKQPYSAGDVTFEFGVSAAPARTDFDSVTIDLNDNAENQQRIKAGTGPAYITWGEREVSGSADHDFDTKDDYDRFVAQTKLELILTGSNSATDDEVELKVVAVAIDSYQTNLTALGELVRASFDYHGYYDTGDVYSFVVKTTESIGV